MRFETARRWDANSTSEIFGKKNQQQFSTSNSNECFEGQRLGLGLGAQILTWRRKVRRRRREASLARVPGIGKLACLRGPERPSGDRRPRERRWRRGGAVPVSDGVAGGAAGERRGARGQSSRRLVDKVWSLDAGRVFNWACDCEGHVRLGSSRRSVQPERPDDNMRSACILAQG